jgi:hypothetical protein
MESVSPAHLIGKHRFMKKNISLSIASPCSEKWNDFTPASGGRFCGSCEKIVVDFTKMSDAEIFAFFSAKPAHTCGRLRPDQLKVYSNAAVLKINPGLTLLKAGLVSLLLLMMSKPASAQMPSVKANTEVVQHPDTTAVRTKDGPKQIVRGLVKSGDDQIPLPGVNVYLKGSADHTVTDAGGQFQFPQRLKAGDVLVFSFIGMETKEHIVASKPAEKLEVCMANDYVGMLGAVAIDEPYTSKPKGLHKLWVAVKSIF